MKAAVLQAPQVLSWSDVPDPEPFGDRPVLVRVGAVGVCGSDLLRFDKGTAYHYPLVLGHEFSAIVEGPPPGSRFAPGDRVAVFPLLANPDDPLTEIGEPALGIGYDYFGSRRDGGMAELLYVPERNLIPVPAAMPLLHAAMVEPAAVALHAVLKLRLPANGSALVIGAGPIGALAAQWLRILGWARVLVADIDPAKRRVMSDLGFETIDAAGDTVGQALALTGTGVDAAVEASGLPTTLLQALEVAAPRGQVLILGDLKGDVTIPRALVSSLIRRELTVLGTWNSKITPVGRSEWEMVIANIVGGRLLLAPLISHAVPLADAAQTFGDLVERRVWSNKVLFAVSAEALAEATDASVLPASVAAANAKKPAALAEVGAP